MIRNKKNRSEDGGGLRKRAEEIAQRKAAQSPEDIDFLTLEETRRMLHELQVHQIELEIQNDELRTTQEALDASRDLYFDLYDLAPVGYCTISEQGLILEANLTAANMLGAVHSALFKQPIYRFILKDDQNIYYRHRKLLFETSEPHECELRMVKPDGAIIWAHLTATAVEYDGGPVCRVVLSDITERKQAENKLKEKEFQYRNLANAGSALIWTSGIDKLCNYFNDPWLKFTGRTLEQEMGNGWAEGVHPEDFDRCLDTYVKAFDKREPFEMEYRLRQASGKYRIILDLGTPNFNSNGELIGYIGHCFDITERKQTEAEREKLQEQLTQIQKMESIGTLAGGIAHDFNNILYPIIGHAEMLLEDIPEEGSIRDSLNQIYSSSLRARDLVQQILAFARQEKSELKLMKMQPIIKEAMKLIRSTIPASIAITQNLQSDCRPVSADPTQIHQIVMNLATNAYHAMAENGGELKVNLKEIELGKDDLISPEMGPGLYACLSFADTGMGINKDVMNRIFDPFFTTKENGKGTGMGLSVVHGIVKQMKGDIQVYSEPGKGTEFRVYLPVVGNASEKQEPKADEPLPGGSERILLVDDEQAIIAIEKRILERLGYQVTSRPGSLEALEAFKAGPDKFDLVITDMSMPNMSGDKLAVELIRIRPDIPILLCTGYSESMTNEKIKSLGIKDLLKKPIVIKDLALILRDMLDKKEE